MRNLHPQLAVCLLALWVPAVRVRCPSKARVLPLGDSITWGLGDHCRPPEWREDFPPAFTNADVGKAIRINGNEVTVEGELRHVLWGDAEHYNCTGKIGVVVEKLKGLVRLQNWNQFENPAAPSGQQHNCGYRLPLYSMLDADGLGVEMVRAPLFSPLEPTNGTHRLAARKQAHRWRQLPLCTTRVTPGSILTSCTPYCHGDLPVPVATCEKKDRCADKGCIQVCEVRPYICATARWHI